MLAAKPRISAAADDHGVPGRRRAVVVGESRGRAAVQQVGRDLDDAIQALGLHYASVGRDVGLSGAQVGRVAHGRAPGLTIVQASTLFAAVGQELSIRTYPTGRPLRDAPQLALLARLRAHVHRSLAWQTEVPVAGTADLRAWDAVIAGADWRYATEAETRLRDWQALQRRITLKVRDGSVDGVVLLVAKTRTNITIVRSLGAELGAAFPVAGAVALERLAAGRSPGGNALILL